MLVKFCQRKKCGINIFTNKKRNLSFRFKSNQWLVFHCEKLNGFEMVLRVRFERREVAAKRVDVLPIKWSAILCRVAKPEWSRSAFLAFIVPINRLGRLEDAPSVPIQVPGDRRVNVRRVNVRSSTVFPRCSCSRKVLSRGKVNRWRHPSEVGADRAAERQRRRSQLVSRSQIISFYQSTIFYREARFALDARTASVTRHELRAVSNLISFLPA